MPEENVDTELDENAATETTTEATVTEPDWRTRFAGDDEKELTHLSKYATEKDFYKSHQSLHKAFSEGKHKNTLTLSDKPTDEEVSAYRESLGIPETADKYEVKLDGVLAEEDQKEFVEQQLAFAHENNMTPKQTQALLDGALKTYQDRLESLEQSDQEDKQTMDDVLREEYGKEFTINMNQVKNMLEAFPEEVRNTLLDSRTADNVMNKNDPEVMKMLVGLARQINPTGVLMPSGVDPSTGVSEEIANIEKKMSTEAGMAEYRADKKMQGRYEELLNWQDSQKK